MKPSVPRGSLRRPGNRNHVSSAHPTEAFRPARCREPGRRLAGDCRVRIPGPGRPARVWPDTQPGILELRRYLFVYDEPHVSGGLSWSGIVWAFTNGPVGEWYPLSMLSHMLDCQLYGLNPAGHHLTNLLLHAASAVTLFLVLWRMTGGLWPSALVAALFALHPLHVESVAWVAERRDVLSGLFFMLTLGAYGEYVRHPSIAGALSRRGRVVRLGPHGQADAGDASTAACCCSTFGRWDGFAGRRRTPPRRACGRKPPRDLAAGAVSLASSWTSCRFWHWPSPRPS